MNPLAADLDHILADELRGEFNNNAMNNELTISLGLQRRISYNGDPIDMVFHD